MKILQNCLLTKMKTKKQIKAFILKTLLPYKEDKSTCGTNGIGCVYLTDGGNKCAVGRWMKKGEHQYFGEAASYLFAKYPMNSILLKAARGMNFSVYEWRAIQTYHDGLVLNPIGVPATVYSLQETFGIELPELL